MDVILVLGGVVGAMGLVVFTGPRFRRAIIGPRFFPYTTAFLMRLAGRFSELAFRFKLIQDIREKTSPELIQCLKKTRARDLVPFRDAYLALDSLPAVAKGKEALALESIFDVFAQRIHFKKSPYTHPLQTPNFFIPGVPAKPFYDPAEFEFTPRVEAAFPEIKEELEKLLEIEQSRFQPYSGGHGHVQPGWNNLYFYLFGKKIEDNWALCPKTAEVLNSIPHIETTMAMFAALNPHAGLPPHTGPANGILRVHLPLIVPDNCRVKVGGEVRHWEEGKVMVFDDSFIHDVQNNSDHVRVVLFFSVYHPCFSEEEIPAIEAFAQAWQSIPVTKLYEGFQHRSRKNNLILNQSVAVRQRTEIPSIPEA